MNMLSDALANPSSLRHVVNHAKFLKVIDTTCIQHIDGKQYLLTPFTMWHAKSTHTFSETFSALTIVHGFRQDLQSKAVVSDEQE